MIHRSQPCGATRKSWHATAVKFGDEKSEKKMLEMTERSQYIVENKGSAPKNEPKTKPLKAERSQFPGPRAETFG
jgi:hypothetical protein